MIDETNTENGRAYLKYKQKYERVYAYSDNSVFHDDIADIDSRLILGAGIAENLDVRPGDELTLIVPGAGPEIDSRVTRFKSLRLVALLETGTEASIAGAIRWQDTNLFVGNSGLVLVREGRGPFRASYHSSGVDFAAVAPLGDGQFLLGGEDGVHRYPDGEESDDG